jgi:hypothetical protein
MSANGTHWYGADLAVTGTHHQRDPPLQKQGVFFARFEFNPSYIRGYKIKNPLENQGLFPPLLLGITPVSGGDF